jgi:hypothetical protein
MVCISLFFILSGFIFYINKLDFIIFRFDLILVGFILLKLNVSTWSWSISSESEFDHTVVVCYNLIIGFVLFLLSEVMLFFGFFWAFFHIAFCSDISLGFIFPPKILL